jgi:response regulator of citrate/malate metabolism
MADNDHMADSSEANDAPLVTTATTTVQEESDSTTMEGLNANNLGKFVQLFITSSCKFSDHSVAQSSGCSQSSKTTNMMSFPQSFVKEFYYL